MAVEFNVSHKRGTEYLFLPEQVKIKPELNGRHETPDIEWLIQDILERGQLQPVVIRNDGGAPVLVAGFSRWRAVSEINKRGLAPVKLTLRCTYFRGSEKEAFLANIAENRHRNATTPIDDAHNIARLERYGMTIAEIAEVYRENEAWCRSRLALISLCEDGRAALKEGKLKPTAAVEIAKLAEEQQREVLAGGKKLTASQVKAIATGKPSKPTLAQIREVLRAVVEDDKLPHGFEVDGRPARDVLDTFCCLMLDYITGKAEL